MVGTILDYISNVMSNGEKTFKSLYEKFESLNAKIKVLHMDDMSNEDISVLISELIDLYDDVAVYCKNGADALDALYNDILE